MGVLWLLNFVLIAFPIGTTVGILMGLQTHRIATGQSPLFVDNGIKWKNYCQKTLGISPPSKYDHYTCKKIIPPSLQRRRVEKCRTALACREPRCLAMGLGDASFLFAIVGLTILKVNPNQWGVTTDTVGSLCVNVSCSLTCLVGWT
jgi:hypothetical protein